MAIDIKRRKWSTFEIPTTTTSLDLTHEVGRTFLCGWNFSSVSSNWITLSFRSVSERNYLLMREKMPSVDHGLSQLLFALSQIVPQTKPQSSQLVPKRNPKQVNWSLKEIPSKSTGPKKKPQTSQLVPQTKPQTSQLVPKRNPKRVNRSHKRNSKQYTRILTSLHLKQWYIVHCSNKIPRTTCGGDKIDTAASQWRW